MSFSEDVAISARCLSHLFNDVVGTVISIVTDDSTWNKALYRAETWTLQAVDQKHLESFEIW